jgi:hypothetical protein
LIFDFEDDHRIMRRRIHHRHLTSASRAGASVLPVWLAVVIATTGICRASTLSIQPTDPETLELHLPRNPLYYFYLQQSTDLRHFTPFSMVLGDEARIWTLSTEEIPARFFTLRQISLFAPEDTDRDGIDDLYEIRHPVLNPLDPYDAGFDSGKNGLTYLQEYRAIYALGSNPPEVYSREVSSFNFGAPLDAAVSRELSVYNFGAPLAAVEALSREVSVFNGEAGDALATNIREVYSREVSTYNFGAPLVAVEALSREVSVFNGEAGPALASDLREVYSREVSTFNFGAPTSPTEAISREVSVFNNVP